MQTLWIWCGHAVFTVHCYATTMTATTRNAHSRVVTLHFIHSIYSLVSCSQLNCNSNQNRERDRPSRTQKTAYARQPHRSQIIIVSNLSITCGLQSLQIDIDRTCRAQVHTSASVRLLRLLHRGQASDGGCLVDSEHTHTHRTGTVTTLAVGVACVLNKFYTILTRVW